jgi:EPS-associated MarR family transcriptional regulator
MSLKLFDNFSERDYYIRSMIEHNPTNPMPENEETYTLLTALHNSSDCTQRELSEELDVSLGKVNYLIKELIKRGFISVKSFSTHSQKIKKVRYFLTKKGFNARVELLNYFLKKKESEYKRLKAEWISLSHTKARQTNKK